MKYRPYHHERPNFFLITLIVIVTLGSIYLVLLNNPKLIVKTPLLEGLSTNEKFTDISTLISPREQSSVPSPHKDNLGQVILKQDHSFILDKELSPSFVFPEKWKIQDIKSPRYSINGEFLMIQDSSTNNIYINNFSTLNPWLLGYLGPAKDNDKPKPKIQGDFIYWIDPGNAFFTFQLSSKKMIWSKVLESENIAEFYVDENQNVILFEQQDQGIKATLLGATDGSVIWESLLKKSKSIYQLQTRTNSLFVYTDKNFFKLNLEDGKIAWKAPSFATLKSPLLVTSRQVVVATTDGQLYSLKSSTGDKIWEYNMEQPSSGSITFIPRYNRVSVMTDDGYIHTVDAFTGERRWKLKIKTVPANTSLQSVKLNSSAIQSLSLEWGKKGWTLWGGCASQRLCVYSPKTGQIIAKYKTNGKILTPPRFFKNSFALLTENQSTPNHPKLVFFLNP